MTNGSELDFDRLIEETQSMIYNLGLRLFRNNADDALDFTQDVYLQAYRKQHQFEGRSRPSTWLYSLALHLGLNRIKKHKRFQTINAAPDVMQESLASEGDSPEDILLEAMDQEHVEATLQEALEKLEEQYRLPLILYYYEQLSYKEISAELGIKEGTLKSYIYRGKLMLRNALKHKLPEGGTGGSGEKR
ncbi:MAG: RNA polymerase sigma factor [Leptospiraceae bacterium]|nr:RNA polymerase sigma factor [Leptospiraceae bacterium]MCB1316148.1 RNA polymerase sigma factor [Leptospiraceae bacterium]MCB1318606.1 RNA polymerase sigma factor [Leptospiraceae bacterium]